jgi:hypothetical protein
MKNSNVMGACVSQNAQADMLRREWTEMCYRLAVCRVTKGGHIEHLLGIEKKLG